ncbi:hypothetical protein [Thalassovita sp.]|uniref:hypothetical protein n=1 Tax=Thalassovita sp. TaxID=1979401 RepID=UPI0029DE8FFE|nr:hypothetical protein [Thalassovita sp.]
MTIAHLLQDFGNYHGSGPDPVISDATLEEHQLEAFEQGYQAGWDDSARAHAEDQARIGEELAATLQQLSFTFHDAQAKVLNALRPLFHQMAEIFLPELARASLPHLIAEQLAALAADQPGETLTLAVSGHDKPAIDALLQRYGSYAVRVVAQPDFPPGHAEITAPDEERRIDLGQVVHEMSQALDAFADEIETQAKA